MFMNQLLIERIKQEVTFKITELLNKVMVNFVDFRWSLLIQASELFCR